MSFLSDKEKKQYSKIVAMLIHGDPQKKVKMDKASAYAIKGIRKLVPNATDEEIAKIMMAISYLFAHIQAAPLMDASNLMQEVFEEYMVGIAILSGAYVPDPENIPDLSVLTEQANQTPGGYTEKEWENHLNKMYL